MDESIYNTHKESYELIQKRKGNPGEFQREMHDAILKVYKKYYSREGNRENKFTYIGMAQTSFWAAIHSFRKE